jgi:acetylornithine aminotransferase
VVTLAKGLGGGLPIGACLATGRAAEALQRGDHGSTFGGNPVACAAACAVCDAIDADLLDNVLAQGLRLRAGLAALPGVSNVRGTGLLVGADLDRPAADLVTQCLELGLVVLSAGERVLRLAPPLPVSTAEVDRALSILEEVLS